MGRGSQQNCRKHGQPLDSLSLEQNEASKIPGHIFEDRLSCQFYKELCDC